MSPAGMGDAFKDWLAPHERAEQTVYEPESPPTDQGKSPASDVASKSASKDASVGDDDERGESDVVTAPLTDTPQPPPPMKRSPGRVQFNHRIRADRDRLLQKYKNKHETTMQAIVDQMVDEYLDRRGLLPKDAE